MSFVVTMVVSGICFTLQLILKMHIRLNVNFLIILYTLVCNSFSLKPINEKLDQLITLIYIQTMFDN